MALWVSMSVLYMNLSYAFKYDIFIITFSKFEWRAVSAINETQKYKIRPNRQIFPTVLLIKRTAYSAQRLVTSWKVRRSKPSGGGAARFPGPIKPPVQQVSGSILGVMRPGCGVDHAPPSSAEVRNKWSQTSTSPWNITGQPSPLITNQQNLPRKDVDGGLCFITRHTVYDYAFSAATRELQNYALKHATVNTSHSFKTNHTRESITRVHEQACKAYFQS
jgi:hypothetical protein